jgi:hypothetical protein
MPEPLQLPESTEDPSTEEEFKAHYAESMETQDRLTQIAQDEERSGNAQSAKLYRELAGVVALVQDIAASCGGAFTSIEDQVDDLFARGGGDAPMESALLKDDATEYVQYFEQVKRLLEGLLTQVPPGSDGDPQRQIFEALLRMTNDRIEFTNEITIEDEPDDDDVDDAADEPDDDA